MNTVEQEIRAIARALASIRTPAAPGEYDIHAEVSRALAAAGLEHCHEYRLAPRCRIDFLVGRTGLEIKKGRPAPSALRAQLARYMASDALDGVIVVVQRAVALPASINGKPVKIISLNRLWGVALP